MQKFYRGRGSGLSEDGIVRKGIFGEGIFAGELLSTKEFPVREFFKEGKPDLQALLEKRSKIK